MTQPTDIRRAHGLHPRLLDLFCCQGGASKGYADAGFDVTGVDIAPQPRYPFRFIQADAIAYVLAHGAEFDFIHGSPPCQHDSECQRIQGNTHPDLIAPTRAALEATGRPWVLENVRGAVRKLNAPVMLCATMFGLANYRHRFFETGGGFTLEQPAHAVHAVPQAKMGRPVPPGHYGQFVGNFSGVPLARDVLGVPWMNRDGIRECIPPAYAEHIGQAALTSLAPVLGVAA
ncbi:MULTISPECIES: SAM-dependent methyltransferase [unclassified Streptomyces]|uniref:SAM-dependent methyltransferase n=1 Tax=unclassified Streptomyces TaxID=2593676 RepID=UPI00225BBC9D|nr:MULTISPECIES: SAM-dependent methyltransferase [unclassified Streptomyces]MCX4991359.1 SAM-dependent methyltransferase [Streptomyces sp. NBC_00568]MCX5003404.1 SAM-dependent methyltransferase [Streptomyces sp. NBC_00638]